MLGTFIGNVKNIPLCCNPLVRQWVCVPTKWSGPKGSYRADTAVPTRPCFTSFITRYGTEVTPWSIRLTTRRRIRCSRTGRRYGLYTGPSIFIMIVTVFFPPPPMLLTPETRHKSDVNATRAVRLSRQWWLRRLTSSARVKPYELWQSCTVSHKHYLRKAID